MQEIVDSALQPRPWQHVQCTFDAAVRSRTRPRQKQSDVRTLRSGAICASSKLLPGMPWRWEKLFKHVQIEKAMSRLYCWAGWNTAMLYTSIYCAAGSTPSADRTTCEDCLMMHYSVNGVDECLPCNLPLAVVDNRCVSGQSIRAMHAFLSKCLVLRYCNIWWFVCPRIRCQEMVLTCFNMF